MEKLRKSWWDNEVQEKYQIIKRFQYLRFPFVLSFWFTIWIIQNQLSIQCLKLEPGYYVYLSSQFLICFLIQYVQNKDNFYKSLLGIALSEYNCLLWWIMARGDFKTSKLLLSNISLSCINICEFPFIKTSFFRLLVLARHLIMWQYIDYYSGSIELTLDTMPHLMAVLNVFLCETQCRRVKFFSFERFLSTQKLESMEKRLSVIFNLYPDGLMVLSQSNTLLYSNAIITKYLGCNTDQIEKILVTIEYAQGKKYSEFSDSSRLIDDINSVKNLQLNQQVLLGISQLGNLNLEWRAQKVLWNEEEVVLLTVKDISHIIELEKSISDNKWKNVLLRSVSHELRTPINAISTISESVMYDSEVLLSKNFATKLNIISVSSKLLLSLINDLLDYSRILAGSFSIVKSKFQLTNTINTTAQLIKLQAEKKGVKLTIRIDPQIPEHIYSDPLRFSQILLNLLSNSLKSTITGYIEICCILCEKWKIKVTVKDTGIGVEETKLINMQKEFKLHQNLTINPTGCGIGLFISNKISKELGTKPIEASSVIGFGSSFSFYVDISEEKAIDELKFDDDISEFTSEEIHPISIKNFKEIISEFPQILIVDDNEFNRVALGTLLARKGYLFDEACTGKEAARKIKENDSKSKPYKLVIMDGCMPELNGWDATKLINQMYFNGKLNSLPIVIGYTAFSSDVELGMCIESGMKECLIKPCDPEILISKISNYLSS
ncbi:unnamed protein product [Blepharisma stoltei]|uniref:Histidine kinase n=1 Tax=Blepharisma stoltei TaxID=1481888 RepID=A0AAU9JNF0_9CILI|nr:unnamed protein product [Blepharisma stoltei]